jgi:nitrosourea synthase
VHSTKHSTLYQDVLASHGLSPVPHTYWEFYLPTSFCLNNYYSYICRDHRHLFKYFGAILQVETAFGVTCRQMAEMMTAVFGPSAETKYFLEHVHIDNHHSRMVFEEIVVPAVKSYGNVVLIDVLRGFEESRLVGDIFSEGLMAQIGWAQSLVASPDGSGAPESTPIRTRPVTDARLAGRWSGTRMTDAPTTYQIRAGELDLVAGYGTVATFVAGQTVHLPAGVLYAACPSPECRYERTES